MAGRAGSGIGSHPGYHRTPDWSKTPIWGKGAPGISGKKRGRKHILDPRMRTAPAVGADIPHSSHGRSKRAPSSVTPFTGGTL